ncbi:DNA polymerase III subunit alpha [Bienertia sinuspersici]
MIRSRAMEAMFRRKGSILLTDNYSFIHSTSRELFVSAEKQKQQENSKVEEEMDEFASVISSFSSCYTPGIEESEAFFSVKTNFNCCSSLKGLEFAENRWSVSKVLDSSEIRRRAIIQEVCHCEGWPFGLCRKALLLPPSPKSPSEYWSWCKGFQKDPKSSRQVNSRLIECITYIIKYLASSLGYPRSFQ